jgi:hypothetical protein
MKATVNTTIEKSEAAPADIEERIRMVAYELWEEAGRPEGKAEEHWSRASGIVMKLDEVTPEWLQRQTVSQAAEPETAKQPQPLTSEAPLDAIRRRLAERKTA